MKLQFVFGAPTGVSESGQPDRKNCRTGSTVPDTKPYQGLFSALNITSKRILY
jgi:hypothetical protein